MTIADVEDMMQVSEQALHTAFQAIQERKDQLLNSRAEPWDADDIGWAVRQSIEDYNGSQSDLEAEIVSLTSDDGEAANISITVKPITRH